MSYIVDILPIFDDNFVFFIVDTNKKSALCIDPGDGQEVEKYLLKNNYTLSNILISHHHADHIGGNTYLKENFSCPIYANKKDKDRIPEADHFVLANNKLQIEGLEFQILDCPGHTIGHIAYYEKNHNWLFSGDTLFSVGCGKMFEGTADLFWQSLEQFKELPDETQIFCSHEYTLTNIAFAKSLSFKKDKLLSYEKRCKKLLSEGKHTIPTNIKTEKDLNPFLNCKDSKEFLKIRQKKDNF